MILISHRGNLNGKNGKTENNPHIIDDVLKKGYDCEIDIHTVEGIVHLGHDNPVYPVGLNWLKERKEHIWVHCKDVASMELMQHHKELNYFWHENDVMTLTSHGYIWVYPGKQPVKDSIAVMPETNNEFVSVCSGICSDVIETYKSLDFL
ncbi:hypothetical protein EBR43_12835 [bacterium]|nr:hypothetical protein [bacterium]